MDITFSHTTSLALIRAWRRSHPKQGPPQDQTFHPTCTGRSRPWTSAELKRRMQAIGIQEIPGAWMKRGLTVLCSDKAGRPKTQILRGRVSRPRPKGQYFLELAPATYVCNAALTLTQLTERLSLPQLISLATELEGSYALGPFGITGEQANFSIKPFVNKDVLLLQLLQLPQSRATRLATRAAILSRPNAWSPQEAVLATMIMLSPGEGGYGLGPVTLNPRIQSSGGLPMTRSSRVPDIVFDDTPLALNYDGSDHLNLIGLERATLGLGADPGSSRMAAVVEQLRQQVRKKYVDDRRRDRDLLVAGLEVPVVTNEDISGIDALDLLMAQLITRLERLVGRRFNTQRAALEDPRLTALRAQTLQELLARHKSR